MENSTKLILWVIAAILVIGLIRGQFYNPRAAAISDMNQAISDYENPPMQPESQDR